MKAMILSVAFLTIVIGCSREPPAPTQAAQPKAEAPSPSAEDLDICETVFRYQFGHNASDVKDKAEAYFLTIFKQDPSDPFLQRFKNKKPPVRKGSEFVGFPWGKGLEFHIDSIKHVDADKVVVGGGFEEVGRSGNANASYNVYTVVRKDGKWVVESDELQVLT
jgi:hypothetical protein